MRQIIRAPFWRKVEDIEGLDKKEEEEMMMTGV